MGRSGVWKEMALTVDAHDVYSILPDMGKPQVKHGHYSSYILLPSARRRLALHLGLGFPLPKAGCLTGSPVGRDLPGFQGSKISRFYAGPHPRIQVYLATFGDLRSSDAKHLKHPLAELNSVQWRSTIRPPQKEHRDA